MNSSQFVKLLCLHLGKPFTRNELDLELYKVKIIDGDTISVLRGVTIDVEKNILNGFVQNDPRANQLGFFLSHLNDLYNKQPDCIQVKKCPTSKYTALHL